MLTTCIIIISGMLYCGGDDFRPVDDIVGFSDRGRVITIQNYGWGNGNEKPSYPIIIQRP